MNRGFARLHAVLRQEGRRTRSVRGKEWFHVTREHLFAIEKQGYDPRSLHAHGLLTFTNYLEPERRTDPDPFNTLDLWLDVVGLANLAAYGTVTPSFDEALAGLLEELKGARWFHHAGESMVALDEQEFASLMATRISLHALFTRGLLVVASMEPRAVRQKDDDPFIRSLRAAKWWNDAYPMTTLTLSLETPEQLVQRLQGCSERKLLYLNVSAIPALQPV